MNSRVAVDRRRAAGRREQELRLRARRARRASERSGGARPRGRARERRGRADELALGLRRAQVEEPVVGHRVAPVLEARVVEAPGPAAARPRPIARTAAGWTPSNAAAGRSGELAAELAAHALPLRLERRLVLALLGRGARRRTRWPTGGAEPLARFWSASRRRPSASAFSAADRTGVDDGLDLLPVLVLRGVGRDVFRPAARAPRRADPRCLPAGPASGDSWPVAVSPQKTTAAAKIRIFAGPRASRPAPSACASSRRH